ncbi:cyclic lactone autoinducer peptide [Eubacterium sp. 1001713B170207_170306_E7]|uniref:cyclic lactone autoinducer peptide n=1 Tax=Eubacterium sp. 1001713B170207_170306_E7 TaxID=2787097 RepID=UPI00189A41D5|nr:cyclic lactone autoinducer peptide [Eubacterium sp. 1001713B170207_170306_E7]
MKSKVKKALIRFGPLFVFLALEMGIFTSNAAACFGFYQPKEPERMAKYKK